MGAEPAPNAVTQEGISERNDLRNMDASPQHNVVERSANIAAAQSDEPAFPGNLVARGEDLRPGIAFGKHPLHPAGGSGDAQPVPLTRLRRDGLEERLRDVPRVARPNRCAGVNLMFK